MRLILYVVVGVIILSLLRSVLEAVGKVFAGGGASPTPTSSGAARGQAAPQSLKKDPVCGTFVSEATPMQKTKGGYTQATARLRKAHDSVREAIGEDVEPRLRELLHLDPADSSS